MARTLALLALTTLLTLAAYGAGPQPVVTYTFLCTDTAFLGAGPCPQGGRPDSLIQGSDGNFYGTTEDSMEGSSTPSGGTVFSVTPAGKFTLLHTFAPGANNNYPNGNLPGNLVEGSDGKLYGSTLFGGIGGCNGYCGSGVLYRVNKDGSGFQILHKFCSAKNCTDGGSGVLVAGTDGNLYGASFSGGTGNCGQYYIGCGTIFKVTPSTGAYAVVVSFNPATTGEFPSGLTAGADGTFHGLNDTSTGESLFHFTPSTGAVTVTPLHFPSVNGLPSHGGDLTLGANGNFYGLYTVYAVSGEGMFEVHPDGSHLNLFAFYTTQEDGGAPDGLLLGSDGNFWVANYNGTNAYGNIIQLSPSTGQLMQTLNVFSATTPVGSYPGEIIEAKDGTLWGSTYQNGKNGTGQFADGTVFSLKVGLPAK